MEYDLQCIGVDLDDMWRGVISVSKVANLTANLRPGSAVYVAEESDLAWTNQEYLLRLEVHALDVANWQRAGDKHIAYPSLIPLPSERAELRRKEESMVSAIKQTEARSAARKAYLAEQRQLNNDS